MAEGSKKGTVDEDGVTEENTTFETGIVQVNEKEYLPSREKNTNVNCYETIQLHQGHGENKRI